MTVVTAARASGTADGLSASGVNDAAVARARGVALGLAALVLGAPSDPAAPAPGLRLEIVTADGTQLVNDLVARRNLSGVVEHNGSGSISFETDLSAFTGGLNDTKLDPSNLVRVHFGDLPARPYGIAEGIMAAAPPSQRDDGSWTLPVSCLGSYDVLDYGLIWPPPGATGDTREFSYTAGMTGPSWVPEEWGSPVGKNVKDSFRWKDRWPANWPESKAEWIGLRSPEAWAPVSAPISVGLGGSVPYETFRFVGQLTAVDADYRFHVAGDDTLGFYIDGVWTKGGGVGDWKKTKSFTRRLAAGAHVISAEIHNLSGQDGKSGFICAIERLNSKGEHVEWVLRSNPDTFQVKKADGYFAQVPLPPDGWYPPAVLWQHVGEAAARGVEFHPQVTLTFDNTKDSDGVAWTTKGPAEYEIGLSGAALGDRVRATDDVAMLPGLRLSAWRSRGFDLRDRVVISKGKVSWPSRTWSRVRTVGLTHQEAGWTETAGDAAIAAGYGRRELALSGGGVTGDTQADNFATTVLGDSASPEETISVEYSTADMVGDDGQPMPFRDFDVADTVSVAAIGGYQPLKVMSIGWAEQDDKSVLFTVTGYPA